MARERRSPRSAARLSWVGLRHGDCEKHDSRPDRDRFDPLAETLAFLTGVGLGGFIDGILLHQILQWHHMLTGDNGGEPATTVAGLEANTLVDGFFHLTAWIILIVATT